VFKNLGFPPLKKKESADCRGFFVSVHLRQSWRAQWWRVRRFRFAQSCSKSLDRIRISLGQFEVIVVGIRRPERLLRQVGQVKEFLSMPEGNHGIRTAMHDQDWAMDVPDVFVVGKFVEG
jgi:hypothetical protein